MSFATSGWSGLAPLMNAAAVGTALYIYWKNRKNQKADIRSRRQVLHAVLRHQVRLSVRQMEGARDSCRALGLEDASDATPTAVEIMAISMWIGNIERLRTLQSKLFSIGEGGDEAAAVYIERLADICTGIKLLEKIIEDMERIKGSPRDLALLNAKTRGLLEQIAKVQDLGIHLMGQLDSAHGAPGN